MSNLKFISVRIAAFIVATTPILAQPLVLFTNHFGIQPTNLAHNNSFSHSNFSEMPLLSSLSVEDTEDLSTISDSGVEDERRIAINAINPGYSTDSGKNSGEMIELINLTDETVSLDDIAIIYAAKPTGGNVYGKSTVLYSFPKGSKFVGEKILMRLDSAPETTEGNQDVVYSTSLAMTGSLAIVKLVDNYDALNVPDNSDFSEYGEVINSVCWLGGEECLPIFSTTVKSRAYTTILRNEETGEYAHVAEYTPDYNGKFSGLYLPPEIEAESIEKDNLFDVDKESECQGLIFSEILSYYDSDASEQFVEFYNSSAETLRLDNCRIKYKNKYYELANSTTLLSAAEYYVFRPEFRLTKNPNTENTLELYDANGTVVSRLSYPHGQKKAASYALVGYDSDGLESWQITYMVTPGAANYYQEYRSCPAGKVINEITGNCVKVTTISNALADCPAGKYRNPATGRCKSMAGDDDGSSECKEGYERNPETNRCRKIKNNNGAEFPIVPITGEVEQTTFIAIWAIVGVVLLGALYVIFQFRKEIKYLLRKIFNKF